MTGRRTVPTGTDGSEVAIVRVLVVSQDPKERSRAASALALHADVEVVEVGTEREAHERVVAEDFDVLVVDGDLAPKGGFSMLYEIREQGELRDEPTPPALIMIAREQDRWLADWAGAAETMRKPVDPFTLAKRVHALAGDEPEPAGTFESGDQVAQIASLGTNPGLAPRP